jgi:hypothetical protein
MAISASADQIKVCAAEKLGLRNKGDDLLLVQLKSNGERITFRDSEVSIPTALTLNGRIFVSPKDHLDALVRINTEFCLSHENNYCRQIVTYHEVLPSILACSEAEAGPAFNRTSKNRQKDIVESFIS